MTDEVQLIKFNRLLVKLTRSYHYSDALHLFRQIHKSHRPKPDHYTLSAALTACANLRDTSAGNQFHSLTVRSGLKAYPHVANTLLSLYAKSEYLDSAKRVFNEISHPDVYSWTTLLSACTKLGEFRYARRLFDQLPHRDVAVWNAMVTGCAENGCEEIAFDLFKRMQLSGVRHDNYTFATVLSLCCPWRFDFGKQVHSSVIKTGFLIKPSVINSLLTMYFNCECIQEAHQVFEETEGKAHDQITYNAMISGLVNAGRETEALFMFMDMQKACLRPTELTFVTLMSLCLPETIAIQLHGQSMKMGFQNFTSVSNAAITMYSNSGNPNEAYLMFKGLEDKDIVSWNAIITSYAQFDMGRPAVSSYKQMRKEGIEPDEFTMGSLLMSSEFPVLVEMIQAIVYKNSLIAKTQVSNALVSAFSKHGDMEKAYRVFNETCLKNLISWNSIISGFQLNGLLLQGLEQFYWLLRSGLSPNAYTLTIVLSICAGVSALRHGKQVHGYILRNGFFSETSLGNALLTLYAKSGVLDWSSRVFNLTKDKDVVSWNSIISAYAQHGEGERAVHCFELMKKSGRVKPDKATFTAVLSACSHAGLVADGIQIFNSMVNTFGFEPGINQFSCVVDLLGRAGYLDAAERLMTNSNAHIDIDSNTWWALFSSCASHGDLRLGRIVAGILLETERNNPATYVVLSNIYAEAGQWEVAAHVRELMKSCGVAKQPGCSWTRS